MHTIRFIRTHTLTLTPTNERTCTQTHSITHQMGERTAEHITVGHRSVGDAQSAAAGCAGFQAQSEITRDFYRLRVSVPRLPG